MTGRTASRFKTAGGVVFSRRGSGRLVVLVHGWCLNRTMWTYAEEALRGGFDVITPDLAGFGLSDGLAGPYSLERHAADLGEVLEEAAAEDAVVVGFAYGAMVAIESARRIPGKIGKVLAVGLPDRSCSPYEKMPRAMRRDWPDFARRSAAALFHNPQSEATLAWVESIFRSAPLPVALETVATLAGYDAVAACHSATVPIVLINGDKDAVAPVASGRQCAEAASDGRLEIIADCGHLIVLDQKAALHALISDEAAVMPARAGVAT